MFKLSVWLSGALQSRVPWLVWSVTSLQTVEQHDELLVHRKKRSGDAGRNVRPDLQQVIVHLSHQRHPHRPGKLHRLDVLANCLAMLLR
jgi:hypothetical protein